MLSAVGKCVSPPHLPAVPVGQQILFSVLRAIMRYKKRAAFVQDTWSQTIHIGDNVNERYVQSINQSAASVADPGPKICPCDPDPEPDPDPRG